MRIIARQTLVNFWSQPNQRDAEADLTAWFNAVNGKTCDWATPADVKAAYRNASIVRDNRVVFNIHGNTYRLVVKINYPHRVVYRDGSVCLNSFRAFCKWISASVMPPPPGAQAG